jgi:hypothetical protein
MDAVALASLDSGRCQEETTMTDEASFALWLETQFRAMNDLSGACVLEHGLPNAVVHARAPGCERDYDCGDAKMALWDVCVCSALEALMRGPFYPDSWRRG